MGTIVDKLKAVLDSKEAIREKFNLSKDLPFSQYAENINGGTTMDFFKCAAVGLVRGDTDEGAEEGDLFIENAPDSTYNGLWKLDDRTATGFSRIWIHSVNDWLFVAADGVAGQNIWYAATMSPRYQANEIAENPWDCTWTEGVIVRKAVTSATESAENTWSGYKAILVVENITTEGETMLIVSGSVIADGNYKLMDSTATGNSRIWKNTDSEWYFVWTGSMWVINASPTYERGQEAFYPDTTDDENPWEIATWWGDMGIVNMSITPQTTEGTSETKKYYTFEETLTEGLTYGNGIIPQVGGIYNIDTTVEAIQLNVDNYSDILYRNVSDTTATASDVKKGKQFYNSDGILTNGQNTDVNVTATTATASDVRMGRIFYNAQGEETQGTSIDVDPRATTATASDVLEGKKFYTSDGVLTTGTNKDVNFQATTANASDVLNGKKFYNSAGVLTTGSLVPQSGDDGGDMVFYKCHEVGDSTWSGYKAILKETTTFDIVITGGTEAYEVFNGIYTPVSTDATGVQRVWVNGENRLVHEWMGWTIRRGNYLGPYMPLLSENDDPIGKFNTNSDEVDGECDLYANWAGAGKTYYEFEETLTTVLTYGYGFTPEVGKNYDSEAMVRLELPTEKDEYDINADIDSLNEQLSIISGETETEIENNIYEIGDVNEEFENLNNELQEIIGE